MKFIISIDGRTCSGKSTLIKLLQDELKNRYGIDVPNFSCGTYYRNILRGKFPNELVDDEMIKYVRSLYTDNDFAIIDGRSVSFSIKTGNITMSNKPLISVLLDVNKQDQLERLLERSKIENLHHLRYNIERDDSDQARCFERYKKNIFDKKYYDFYINTSESKPEQSVFYLMDIIPNVYNMRKTTLLYSEECDTALGKKLLNRPDINTIYLRFSKHLNFNEQYLIETYGKNIFTVDPEKDIDDEVTRFHNWTSEIGLKPDNFYNDSEFLQQKSNLFAEKVGLPALTQEQVLWVRDKVKMKEKLQSLGVPVSAFQPIDNYNDIITFAKTYNFPIIFKRRSGFSSIDTYKLNSLNDLPIKDTPNGKFMVEKFNDGREWIIDGLVQDTRLLKTLISYVPTSPLVAMTEHKLRGHIAHPNVPSNFNFNPDELIQKIITGMNLRNGYIHLECFIGKDGLPTVGELGWRTAGHRIIDNHSYALGFDIHDILLDVVSGKPVKIPSVPKSNTFIGNTFLPKKSGIITEMMSSEQISAQDGVFKTELFAKIGQNFTLERKSSETAGYAFVKGDNILDVENKMQTIYDNFYQSLKTK
jgi:cytidylate kinase